MTVGGPDGLSVREIEFGTTVGGLAAAAGMDAASTQAVLLGGYFGAWVARDEAWSMAFDPTAMRREGRALGCGVASFLPSGRCGVDATARIMEYLAGQSAAQCGPCVFGLRAIADTTVRIASGRRSVEDLERIERWGRQLVGRGACRHPDGAAGLLASALRTFADEFVLHAQSGRCSVGGARVEAA
jgi:NADH:ubiquinone oxidoreductase subunit F (NADH-binding)